MEEMTTFILNSPITEEQWDAITDVDFERTNEITFHTKHGKIVKFVKAFTQPDSIESSLTQNALDTISRQAAIDALCKAVDAKGTYDGEWLYTDEFCKVVNDLPPAQPEPQWIPCSERMPFAEYGESPNVYCYCCDLERGGKWAQLLYFNGGVWCLPTGETFAYKVLAWYPLPTKPYKEGEKE